jgi:hypothetical protein
LQESTDTAFFQKIQAKLDQAKSGFVIDGNYTRTTQIKWRDIDTVICWIFLLYQSLPIHTELFVVLFLDTDFGESSNNRESFSKMFSRDSIIWWMIKTHQKSSAIYNNDK